MNLLASIGKESLIKTLASFLLVLSVVAACHVRPAGAAETAEPPYPTPSVSPHRLQENAAPAVHDAYVQIIRGNFEEALRLSDEAIAQNPTDADAHVARSLALASLGDNEAALASADMALTLDPASGAAYFARGTALLRMGEQKQARESFTKACDLGETRACKFLY